MRPFTLPVHLILVQGAQKAQDLTRKLTKFGGNIQFIEVPFTEIQEEIKAKAPEAYLNDPNSSLYDADYEIVFVRYEMV